MKPENAFKTHFLSKKNQTNVVFKDAKARAIVFNQALDKLYIGTDLSFKIISYHIKHGHSEGK